MRFLVTGILEFSVITDPMLTFQNSLRFRDLPFYISISTVSSLCILSKEKIVCFSTVFVERAFLH